MSPSDPYICILCAIRIRVCTCGYAINTVYVCSAIYHYRLLVQYDAMVHCDGYKALCMPADISRTLRVYVHATGTYMYVTYMYM